MEMNKDLLEKAKVAKTAEELIAIAKENEVEMTEESAKAYFELVQAQTKTGELSDEELDNIAGGGCNQGDGRLIVTTENSCEYFCCDKCGGYRMTNIIYPVGLTTYSCSNHDIAAHCKNCKHMSYESGLWLCNHPKNRE